MKRENEPSISDNSQQNARPIDSTIFMQNLSAIAFNHSMLANFPMHGLNGNSNPNLNLPPQSKAQPETEAAKKEAEENIELGENDFPPMLKTMIESLVSETPDAILAKPASHQNNHINPVSGSNPSQMPIIQTPIASIPSGTAAAGPFTPPQPSTPPMQSATLSSPMSLASSIASTPSVSPISLAPSNPSVSPVFLAPTMQPLQELPPPPLKLYEPPAGSVAVQTYALTTNNKVESVTLIYTQEQNLDYLDCQNKRFQNLNTARALLHKASLIRGTSGEIELLKICIRHYDDANNYNFKIFSHYYHRNPADVNYFRDVIAYENDKAKRTLNTCEQQFKKQKTPQVLTYKVPAPVFFLYPVHQSSQTPSSAPAWETFSVSVDPTQNNRGNISR